MVTWNTTDSVKYGVGKSEVYSELCQDVRTFGTKYSRMDQVKFVEDNL